MSTLIDADFVARALIVAGAAVLALGPLVGATAIVEGVERVVAWHRSRREARRPVATYRRVCPAEIFPELKGPEHG